MHPDRVPISAAHRRSFLECCLTRRDWVCHRSSDAQNALYNNVPAGYRTTAKNPLTKMISFLSHLTWSCSGLKVRVPISDTDVGASAKWSNQIRPCLPSRGYMRLSSCLRCMHAHSRLSEILCSGTYSLKPTFPCAVPSTWLPEPSRAVVESRRPHSLLSRSRDNPRHSSDSLSVIKWFLKFLFSNTVPARLFLTLSRSWTLGCTVGTFHPNFFFVRLASLTDRGSPFLITILASISRVVTRPSNHLSIAKAVLTDGSKTGNLLKGRSAPIFRCLSVRPTHPNTQLSALVSYSLQSFSQYYQDAIKR